MAASDGTAQAVPGRASGSPSGQTMPPGAAPPGPASGKGSFQIVNDVAADDAMDALARLCGAVRDPVRGSLPALARQIAVIGALTLYSQQPGFFEQDRVELLNEMAQDISFALDHLAAEEARQEPWNGPCGRARPIWPRPRNWPRWAAGSGMWPRTAASGRPGMEKIYGFPFEDGLGSPRPGRQCRASRRPDPLSEPDPAS